MLFDEILFIVKSVLIEGYRQEINRRYFGVTGTPCRYAYDIFLSVEQIEKNMKLVLKHYFPIALDSEYLQNSHYGRPVDKWLNVTNQDFNYLTRSMQEFIRKAQKYSGVPMVEGGYLSDFFNAKSNWSEAFINSYSSGELNQNNLLTIKYLSFAKPLYKNWPSHEDKISYFEKSNTIHMDVSTLEKRLKIVEESQANLDHIQLLKLNLIRFIKKHCSIDSFLYNI